MLIIALCWAAASVVAAEQVRPPPRSPVALEVVYDRAADLISVRARAARLAEVLGEISRAAAVTIAWRDTELRTRPSPSPLITRHWNKRFSSYSTGSTAPSPTHPRMSEPALLAVDSSRSSSCRAGQARPSSAGEADADARAATDSTPEAGTPRQPDSGSVVRHLIGNRFAAREIVDSLTRGADATLREATEDALVQLLSERDFRLYGRVVDVLKDLAPEKAIAALTRWLDIGDSQMRVVAAAALGQIKHDRSVEALTAGPDGDGPMTPQAAASSLARIGGSSGERERSLTPTSPATTA